MTPRKAEPTQTPDSEPSPSQTAPRRRRRNPEEARAAILDAAERLFAEHGPDRVSVLDVAVEAGVSHSLVLHYFKSYAELVRSVLTRRNKLVFQQIKERLLAAGEEGNKQQPEELLGLFLGVVCEPTHARLLAWAALSGEGKNLQMVKNRGLAKVVDLAAGQIAARRGRGAQKQAAPSRDRVEDAVLIALAAVHGYATGKQVYLPALGHSDPDALDARFRRALGAMLRSFLDEDRNED